MNIYGQYSMTDGFNFKDINRKGIYGYWDHMDYIIKSAASRGIYIGMVCIWGTPVEQGLMNEKEAVAYGKFLAERYKDEPNIIWMIGGDIRGDNKTEVWDALANSIRSIDKGHLMTFHPRGRTTSATWFNDREWLDFNMFQSGHRRYGQRNGDGDYPIEENTDLVHSQLRGWRRRHFAGRSALDILFLAAFLDYLFSYLCHLYSFTPLLLLIRNSLRRTLACSCVCLSALTSDGQTLAMTDTTVAVNLYHALDVECNITAEVTLYLVVCFDFLTELCDLLLGECLSAGVRIDACLCKYLIRSAATYTVDIGKGDLNALSVRNIYACNTCHLIYSLLLTRQESALSLFVFRILAYHHDLAVATDNLTFIAYLFNGRFNFHFNYRSFLPWYAM